MFKNKFLKTLAALIFWIFVWQTASILISDSLKIFLPSPISVLRSLYTLLPQYVFWAGIGKTLLRILCGFLIGSIAGMVLAVLTSEFKIFDMLFSPALQVIRAVPVVSFIILAFLFIRVDNLPVFISALMVVSPVWQNVSDGLASTDKKLLQMGKVYKLNSFKSLIYIKLPCSLNIIISALINAVGLAWKSGVAAEVICTPAISMGKMIYKAKGNLEFDKVYALTVTVVILSLIFEFSLKKIWKNIMKRKGEKS